MIHIKCTQHGETRLQQRGISMADVLIVYKHGTLIDNEAVLLLSQDVDREIRDLKREIRRAGSGASHTNHCRRMIRALERNRNRQIVLNGDQLVTAYRPRRSAQRRALRLSRTNGYSK